MKQSFLLFFFMILAFSLFSQTPEIRKKQYNLSNNLAISGYDPVAYFTSKKAIKGKSTYSVTEKNVTYYFS